MLGTSFYFLSARYRKVSLEGLTIAYGDSLSIEEKKIIAKNAFRHFSQAALEFFWALSLDRTEIDSLIKIENKEYLDKALEKGKGAIILTGHYGNWEFLARKLVILGYKVNVIARDSDDPGMTGITTRIREHGGYRVFDKDQPIIGAMRALKNNECLGILPDQNDSKGIFVKFFGRLCATATGPAAISLKSGCPIVPIFNSKMPDGSYLMQVYPEIEYTPTGDNEKDIYNLTALINDALEIHIRKNPSQWLWLHDRWKLSPENNN